MPEQFKDIQQINEAWSRFLKAFDLFYRTNRADLEKIEKRLDDGGL